MTMPPFQFTKSVRMMCLNVGSRTKTPVPVYSGLIVDSPLAFAMNDFFRKSPAPLIPVVACTSPTINCIAPG